MVCDVPFTVAVAVLMSVPELLAVGVVPPPPYCPPLLVVGVVPAVEGADPVVLLPQAVKRTTRVAMSAQHQERVVAREGERLLNIVFPPLLVMILVMKTSEGMIHSYIRDEVTLKGSSGAMQSTSKLLVLPKHSLNIAHGIHTF